MAENLRISSLNTTVQSSLQNWKKAIYIVPNDLIHQAIIDAKRVFLKGFSQPSFFASVFSSKLMNIPEVVSFKIIEQQNTARFFVFIKEPNWTVEEEIYKKYIAFLDEYPEAPDMSIIDLSEDISTEFLAQL